MKISPYRQITLIFTSLFIMLCVVTDGRASEREYRVLLLNSYNQDMLWTANVTDGVKSVLDDATIDIKLSIEFMDTKNFFTPAYLDLLAGKYALKYGDVTFDAVIASDDNAVDFALKHRDKLFKGAPIIFCGVNDLEFQKRSDFKNITGVLEFLDVAGTIQSALRLQADLKRVFIVIDDTTTGKITRSVIESVLPDFADRLEFQWIEKMPMEGVKRYLEGLPPQSAVLLAMYNQDSTGKRFTYSEAVERLAPSSRVPVYGMWDFYLGKGIVGGMITSGKRQGAIAGRMVLDVLGGKKPHEVPVVVQKSNKYGFDFTVLRRFNLDTSDLPEDAVVLNVPESVLQKYGVEVWTISVLIVFLSGVIVVLLVNNRARRTAELELEELSRYQETLIEQRTEELVQRSRELEKANYELKQLDSLKTSVLNTVSHDLRTPLTSVLGFCKIINRDFVKYFKILCDQDPVLSARGERIVSNLSIVEKEGERLTRLINDFLDLSKIESGDMPWSDVMVDPADVIRKSIPLLEGYVSETDIAMEFDLPERLPVVGVDPDRLLQVLNNLVGNGVKFTNKGKITVSASADDEWVSVSVSDTGVGIPQDHLGSIFNKFYQVEDVTADLSIPRGSGMGLAISKRIIDHYGGTIDVSSTPGEGSTFTFTLPIAG